jgi:subtilisin family serine protease
MLQPLLDQSVPQVGAPAAWGQGLDGTGMRVAVLDTGIDVTHPDLAGRVVGQANFTEGFEDDRDLVGHGTHVASTVAGSGAASGGRYRGVAPGAGLLDGKVCVEFGCAHSWVLAGMQWAAEQGADVVNLSLGGPDTPGLDPVEEAVGTLSAQYGVLFVIAAGNSGADASIDSPGSADAALTVGAVDKADQLGGFSSRGPRLDGGLKPDLTAPGVDIVAANSKDGFLGEPGQPYTTLSGTSMATPHVAGAAAILAQQHPDWSPEQLKAGLMGSAVPHPDLGAYAQGAGRLDVARAVGQSVTANPPGVGFELALWPHEDDQPQTRTISYRNHGTAEVVLELAVATIGPDGQPAPDGMFTLSDSSVTIPAGGGVEVSLTADTTLGDVTGYLGGRITATGSGQVVTTPFAIEREAEIYDLTLVHTDRTGAPTTTYITYLVRVDTSEVVELFFSDSTATVRVPPGEYVLISLLLDFTGAEPADTLLGQPTLVVDRDQTVAIDAREGRPISVTVPDPEAAPAVVGLAAEFDTGELSAGSAWAAAASTGSSPAGWVLTRPWMASSRR